MVIAEIILYFAVLALYFLPICIRKCLGNIPHSAPKKDTHPYDTNDYNLVSKPKWLLKAHYGFLIFMFIILFLALTVAITWIWSYLQKTFIFTDLDAIYLGSEWGITGLPVLFMSLCISNLILESCPFRSARYAAVRYYHQPELPHKMDIHLTKLLLIIFFAVGFPFIILNTDYYSCVKDNGFYTHPFFSFSEIEYRIPSDIEYVTVTYNDDDRDDYDFYYTVYFTNGKNIEILNDNRFGSAKVVQIDSILKASNIPISRSVIPYKQWQRDILDDYNDDLVQSLKQLYQIE